MDLSSIGTGVNRRPPKILLYGTGGIGKTTFASQAPNPIFACAEAGADHLDVARFEPDGDSKLTTFAQIEGAMRALLEPGHDYQTFVLDALDAAESMAQAAVCEEKGWSSIEEPQYGKGVMMARERMRVLLHLADRLRSERNMAIIVIAHDDIVRVEDPETDSFDRHQPLGNKKLVSEFIDWADIVLYAHYRQSVVTEEMDFGRKRKRGVGTGERVMETGARPAWVAKSRFDLPAQIPLSWAALAAALYPEK